MRVVAALSVAIDKDTDIDMHRYISMPMIIGTDTHTVTDIATPP